MIQKIDNATVREAVQQAYERCKNETGGKNADYIPYLRSEEHRLNSSHSTSARMPPPA